MREFNAWQMKYGHVEIGGESESNEHNIGHHEKPEVSMMTNTGFEDLYELYGPDDFVKDDYNDYLA